MIETNAILRKWGRSLGLVIPMKEVISEDLKENDIVEISIKKKSNPLKETFGIFKFKKSTEKILKDSDKELWDE